MKDIPTIGGARGIFEVFVPGLFLLLNLGTVVYLFPSAGDETKLFIAKITSYPALVLVFAIGFGYLCGILLRLLKTDWPDEWSAKWLQTFCRWTQDENGKPKSFVSEDFPYLVWIKEVCERCLPNEALDFYRRTWGFKKRDSHGDREFFDFCKVIISAEDEQAADGIYAAEALTRYISGMFYALIFSAVLLSAMVLLSAPIIRETMTGLAFILLAYVFSIIVILRYFRFIRIKEVKTVFAASFKNKTVFLDQAWFKMAAPH